MAWTYAESRQVTPPDVQHRKYCPACHREWIFATYAFTPPAQCPACGSPDVQDIDVRGLFDSTTDLAATAAALAGLSPEAIAEEAAARARCVSIQELVAPPPALVADRRPSFAPELD